MIGAASGSVSHIFTFKAGLQRSLIVNVLFVRGPVRPRGSQQDFIYLFIFASASLSFCSFLSPFENLMARVIGLLWYLGSLDALVFF